MLLAVRCALCRDRTGTDAAICAACRQDLVTVAPQPPPLWLDRCEAVFGYERVGPALTALKNGDRRDVIGWLAELMSGRLRPPEGAVVTWAPTTPARRRSRGFDQAELLARAVGRRWGRPARPLLVRMPGPAQAGLSRTQRATNPVFRSQGRAPGTVVLVDDVVTTGGTLTAAARALRAAGAETVLAVVAARARGGPR